MRIALLAAIFVLSACQSGHHTDYAGDETATLVFSSNNVVAQPIICVPGKGIQDTPLSLGLGGYKILDDLNEAMKKSPEVRAAIPGNATVIAGFRYSQRERFAARKQCRVLVSIDALAGQTYQLRLEDSSSCTITATRLDGENWVAQDVRRSDAGCD